MTLSFMKRYRLEILLVLALGLIAGACGKKEPSIESLLLGNWRAQNGKIHTILTFRQNGSLQWDIKIEGRHTRIVEKKQSIGGSWTIMEDGGLQIIPAESLPDANLRQGEPIVFEVLEINKRHLNLRDPSGKLLHCLRVRTKQSQAGDLEDGLLTLHLQPLVVNLHVRSSFVQSKYFCLDMSLILDTGQSLAETQGLASLSIHPRVRELILLYLSDQYYDDLNSFEKINYVMSDLKVVLNPYFNATLQEIKVNRVIVTSNMEKVHWFMNAKAKDQSGENVEDEEKPQENPKDDSKT